MLIRMSWWREVRSRFSEQERDQLHRACTGETVCPPGVIVDASALRPELRRKLEDLGNGHEAKHANLLAAHANG
jgi:hypothetical protein